MARRFYFTDENADNIANDHLGNIRGARIKAMKLAEELKCNIYINDCDSDDIVDVIFYEEA